ncbi:U-box domain-containing protein 13 [Ricinus communis]|uniref:Ubiquitin-protein ligase, putative n=1 Tax=Ricinus communis TaxID=3988 RepID=B9RNX0_RICCO|nr:U-box domain-containing protein 13 [Ricinus communis]EEF46888.1 ubiquitin-protein ligase, putative [Ricinus communis]|eukprot:XP_002515439.1 U-box domain-containing protein 13 [Ricinus communis]
MAAKCTHRNNNIGSLILNDRHSPASTTSRHFRLWTSSFRRKIFDAVSCGGSSRYRHHEDDFASTTTAATATTATATATTTATTTTNAIEKTRRMKNGKSEKLSDLLSVAEAESEIETRKKVEELEELKSLVKELQIENDSKRKEEAASRVRLLAKEDSGVRVTLALLGAIPPLVAMIDFDNADLQIASLYALLNLAIANDANKAAIVKAGAVHKMLKIIELPYPPKPSVSEAIVANFLGLSALDSNKPIIGSSGAIPFLVNTLRDLDHKCSIQAKQDAVRALYNLSIFSSNVSFIVEANLIPFLMNTLGDMEVSERILSILSNLVSTPEGRKAISTMRDAFTILIDVLNWTDSPGCQEKASYILMVMAHKAYGDRQAMIEAGIVSALLELTLLGSTLAQKRASRILECLRVDKGKQISDHYGGNLGAAVSAPIYGSSSSSANPNGVSKEFLEEAEDTMSEEKKAVKQLVQQSLQTNMMRIVKRANLPQDFVPSEHFKSLTASSTSKSLPF